MASARARTTVSCFFAGASVEGASIQPDGDAIHRVYGGGADSREILLGTKYVPPAAARLFMTALRALAAPSKKR
jgi:lipid-binding SYLF domain-containing protein